MNRNRSTVFILGSLILTSSLLIACGGTPTTAQAAPETTAAVPEAIDLPVVTASVATMESTLEISGTLAPRTRVGVKPKLPGTLEKILVDVGDAVTAGQTLATIDRREIDAQADAAVAQVAVAKAALETADASLANAVLEHERAQNLFDKGALPRQRLDAADTAHRASKAQRDLATANLAQAEAALHRAREVQSNATITSPVTGVVVERNYDAGAIPGDKPVFVVADLREMKLEAGVSELEAGRLRLGLKADVNVQAKPGETFTGQLATIAPEADERNRHFQIEVRVQNGNRALLSGMFATARIVESTTPNAIVVPRDAIVVKDGQSTVLKVSGGTASPVAVVTGAADGTRVQIVKGLTAGDTVAADARRPITPGAKVRAVQSK